MFDLLTDAICHYDTRQHQNTLKTLSDKYLEEAQQITKLPFRLSLSVDELFLLITVFESYIKTKLLNENLEWMNITGAQIVTNEIQLIWQVLFIRYIYDTRISLDLSSPDQLDNIFSDDNINNFNTFWLPYEHVELNSNHFEILKTIDMQMSPHKIINLVLSQ
jgi:hypothetical protein